MIRWHVVSAIFWRNFKQYFTSVSGYLFIVVFVTVCALLAFNRQFFFDNLANLNQLNESFPLLLLFLVPAVTMGTWADERRQGTDAILFTLPASNVEILIGKYLSVAAVYSVALLFSLTQLLALANIGRPDWGVVATTYLGYWLSGCALLAVGMFASSLTSSNTVAFILGALFCSVPVLAGTYFRGWLGLERLGFAWHLRDFNMGLLSLTGVLYFLSVIALMLYLNLVVITRRHWSRGQQRPMALQFGARTLGLALALAGLNDLAETVSAGLPTRIDLTRDALFTLDSTTRGILRSAEKQSRPVTIQAYVSREVPREYVHVKNHLLGLLRQFDRIGGPHVEVQVTEVRPSSREANAARTHGVQPVASRSEVGGRTIEQDVFLGAYAFSQLGDSVVPVVDGETSVEFELTRAIANVIDKKKQMTVGVLTTDLFFLGPLVREEREEWSFNTALRELKQTYQFKPVSAEDLGRIVAPPPPPAETPAETKPSDGVETPVDGNPPPETPPASPETPDPPAGQSQAAPATTAGEIWTSDPAQDVPPPESEPSSAETPPDEPRPPPPDVLLVVGPSSLPDQALNDLIEYIRQGRPVLILEDPLPFYWTFISPDSLGVLNAPRQPRVGMQSSARPFLTDYMEPKAEGGRLTALLAELGIRWNNGATAWHDAEPPPGFQPEWPRYLGDLWPDYYGPQRSALVFVERRGDARPFNAEHPVSKGLNRLLFAYPGFLQKTAGGKTEVTPLIQLSASSGSVDWDELTFTPNDSRFPGSNQPMISDITGGPMIVLEPDPPLRVDAQPKILAAHIRASKPGASGSSANVIFIADTDFLSEFSRYQQGQLEEPLDNLKLIENALEVLAGDPGFVRLRNRRPTPPSLSRFEAMVEKYRRQRIEQQQKLEGEIQVKLAETQSKVDEAAKAIQEDKELDLAGKLQQLTQNVSEAQRRFDIQRDRLERDRRQQIDQIRAEELQNIARAENWVRGLSVALAPLPAVLLGFLVLVNRFVAERRQIRPERRV